MRKKILLLAILCQCLIFCPNIYSQENSCLRCIIVYGDTRTNHDMHQKVVDRISAQNPKVVFHTGDMVDDGYSKEEWKIFNKIVAPLRKKAELFGVIGNHEKQSPLFFKSFNLQPGTRWYSVNRYGMHFIVLDSESPFWKETGQYCWLEEDLKQVRKKDKTQTVIILLHRPIYSTGSHGSIDEPVMERLVPLFKKYDVDIVFSGHDHDYERSYKDGIYYIVSGGGGAPLRAQKSTSDISQVFHKKYHYCALSFKDNKLEVEVFDDNDKEIDHFTISMENQTKQ